MAKYSKPWWVECQWEVEAETKTGWKPIYCTRKKTNAQKDAKAWTEKMGQRTRVGPAAGHKSRRPR